MTSDLIDRLDKCVGADREIDLAIHIAIYPHGDIAKVVKHRRGLDHEEGMAWEIWHSGSVVFEQYRNGQCTYNGGYPLPAVTGSIDAAMTLLGDDLYLIALHQLPKSWIAKVGSKIDDRKTVEVECATAPSAISSAALRARAVEMMK